MISNLFRWLINVNIFGVRAWKSRKYVSITIEKTVKKKKNPGAFVTIQLWRLNESLFVTQDVNF